MPWTEGAVSWRVELALGAAGGAGSIWDTGLWDTTGIWGGSAPTWVVVTGDVLAARTSRGRDRWGTRVRTANASVTLANETGKYNPDHGATPPGDLALRPGRWIRVSANAGAGWVPQFTGSILDLDESYAPAGENIITRITAFGFQGLLGQENPPALGAPVGAGERTDERVTRVLDAFGWPDGPGDRDLQTGLNTMTATTLARTRLEEIQRASVAEGAVFFFSGAGVPTFKARDWLQSDTRSTTAQLFPNRGNAGDPDVIDVATEWSAQLIRNDVQYTRVGGTMVRVQDTSSQAIYRAIFSEVVNDLEVETDVQVSALAGRFLAARAYDQQRVRTLELHAPGAAAAAAIFATELGDLVTASIDTLHGWSYDVDAHVMGIDFEVTAEDWTVTLRLDSDLASEFYWVLENATLGVLGSTTRLRPY